jgi:hypothetical protein
VDEIIHLEGIHDCPEISHLAEEPVYVPLTIYVGNDRRIIGDARVVGNRVEAVIHPKPGEELFQLAREGIIQSVSVAFNAPPATPIVEDGKHIRWVRNY